jgi:hypothetical protein
MPHALLMYNQQTDGYNLTGMLPRNLGTLEHNGLPAAMLAMPVNYNPHVIAFILNF